MNTSTILAMGVTAAACLFSGLACTTETVYLPRTERRVVTERRYYAHLLPNTSSGSTYGAYAPRGESYGGVIVGSGSSDAPEHTRFVSGE